MRGIIRQTISDQRKHLAIRIRKPLHLGACGFPVQFLRDPGRINKALRLRNMAIQIRQTGHPHFFHHPLQLGVCSRYVVAAPLTQAAVFADFGTRDLIFKRH